MRPIDSISVLLPTWQAMEYLERVFDALAAQRCALPWDVHVIDSGSTDGTPEYLERLAPGFPVPLHVRRIPQEEFDHGDTRNELAARSRGELLVLLTQDAIPSAQDWLSLLARNFEDADVGAAYCRNVPRADALPLTKIFSSTDPGYASQRSVTRPPDPELLARMTADNQRRLYSFNDVASAVRRELWERHPFPRTMMGEDVLMGRAVLLAGYAIVYDAEATVDHSHDYGAEKMHWRGEVDARFNAEYLDRICVTSEVHRQMLTRRLVEDDLGRIELERGLSTAEHEALGARARELREAFVRGLYAGGLAPARFSATSMRASGDLHLFYVVESRAALEPGAAGAWRVDALARAMEARGHRVTLLVAHSGAAAAGTDAGAAPGVALPARQPIADASLRVLEFACTDRPTDDPTAQQATERTFTALLADEAPDVVHFFGLPGHAVGLPRATRLAGIPAVVSVGAELLDQLAPELPRADGRPAACSPGSPVPSGPAVAAALRSSALCLVAGRGLREELLAAVHFHPRRLVVSEPDRESQPELPGAPARTRELVSNGSLAETAVEFEYRYRGLACIVDPANMQWKVLLASTGQDAARTTGECEPQSEGMLLLRPGASAEYRFDAPVGGPVSIEFEQFQLASESDIVLGGILRAGELRPEMILATRAGERDGSVRQTFEVVLPEGTQGLVFEAKPQSDLQERFLRIARVSATGWFQHPGPDRA